MICEATVKEEINYFFLNRCRGEVGTYTKNIKVRLLKLVREPYEG